MKALAPNDYLPQPRAGKRARSDGRYLLSRFPYSIVYVVAVDGGITVAAVAHTKRKHGYWLRRV